MLLWLRREHYDKTRELYEKRFAALMAAAAKSGRISPNAADLLVTLYTRLEGHFFMLNVSCYLSIPLKRRIKTEDTLSYIEHRIKALAAGAATNRKARYELMLDLERMQTHLIEKREAWMLQYQDEGKTQSYEEAKQDLRDLVEKRCSEEELAEAAAMLIRVAPRLPKDWGVNPRWDRE